MASAVDAPRRRMTRAVTVFVALLILIMMVAVARRMSTDVPNVLAGTLPPDIYDVRFVEHHWPAYLHIGPGILYLLGLRCSCPIASAAATAPSTAGCCPCHYQRGPLAIYRSLPALT